MSLEGHCVFLTDHDFFLKLISLSRLFSSRQYLILQLGTLLHVGFSHSFNVAFGILLTLTELEFLRQLVVLFVTKNIREPGHIFVLHLKLFALLLGNLDLTIELG